MPNDQNTNLAGTVATLYCNHCGLFWRIMMPVAIIAIILEIAMYFHFVTGLEKHYQNVEAATTNVNTISGIHPTSTSGVVETSSYLHVSWQFYLIPNFHYIWNGQMSDRTL